MQCRVVKKKKKQKFGLKCNKRTVFMNINDVINTVK